MLPIDVKSNVLFVDPGLGGTGWAFFDTFTKSPPIDWGVLRRPEGDWTIRARDIARGFKSVVSDKIVYHVVIEMPSMWSGSAQSHASTVSGDLFKLAFLVGSIAQWFACHRADLQLTLISPQEWKGQLPKELVIKRIVKRFPNLDMIANHEADAIGMGLACQGLL